jgi:hypothetical protein
MSFQRWLAAPAILTIGFFLGLWALNTFAAEPAPAPVLSTWVHVFGCPKPAADVVLIFTDGRIVHLQDAKLTDEQKVKLLALIGNTQGVNIVYDCGIKT